MGEVSVPYYPFHVGPSESQDRTRVLLTDQIRGDDVVRWDLTREEKGPTPTKEVNVLLLYRENRNCEMPRHVDEEENGRILGTFRGIKDGVLWI